MHGTQCVIKSGMYGTGIDQLRQAKLFDVPQSLKVGVFDKFECQFSRNGDKPINRVIYDFLFVDASAQVLGDNS